MTKGPRVVAPATMLLALVLAPTPGDARAPAASSSFVVAEPFDAAAPFDANVAPDATTGAAMAAAADAVGASQGVRGVDPLPLATVLRASDRHFPGVLEALARERGARGDLLAAEGAFDLVYGLDGYARTSGFYDGRVATQRLEQPLGPLGAKVYGEYQISNGDFPIYEDESFTNTGGRAKVGVLFSLLRDRDIDDRRFGVTDARLARRDADLSVLLTRVGVQRQAIGAYWRWVMAGRQLRVYEDLLSIALRRQEALEREVSRGARAAIFLTENMQNITRREALLAGAWRDFRLAANELSFYYRGEGGEPRVPGEGRLPGEIPEIERAPRDIPVDDVVRDRPEIARLRTELQRALNEVALKKNALAPRVDLKFEVGEPIGAVAEGGRSRDTTETVVGLTVSVPLQRRTARGELDSVRAEVDAIEARRRALSDRIGIEIDNLVVELDAALELADLAEREVQQAQAMMRAERQRFERGASDFFLLNLREQAVADARVRALQADLSARVARAEFDAATVNMARLGLEG